MVNANFNVNMNNHSGIFQNISPFYQSSNYLVDDLFVIFLSVFGGFFLAFSFVAHLVKYAKGESESESEGDLNDSDLDNAIEYKYYEELNALEVREMAKEELDALQFKFVDIETPDGLVKMTYNNSTGSFWYYTDNKNVHYKYLDAVARYFTIENNCRQICVNYKDEINKGIITVKEKMADEEKRREDIKNLINQPTTEKKSVFAKFKNYNLDDNKQQKLFVLTDKANQFKFAGSMNDYLESRKEKIDCVSKMDYATFKKLLENKNHNSEISKL